MNEKKFLALKCFSCKKNTLNLSVRVAIMLKSAIFILELLFLSFVHCQRYYAFVETLFVIDKRYFPTLSEMTYEKYVQTIVDTANIVKNERSHKRQLSFLYVVGFSII